MGAFLNIVVRGFIFDLSYFAVFLCWPRCSLRSSAVNRQAARGLTF